MTKEQVPVERSEGYPTLEISELSVRLESNMAIEIRFVLRRFGIGIGDNHHGLIWAEEFS